MRSPLLPLRSIRHKLFAGVLLTSIAALLVAGLGLFVYDVRTYREAAATDLAVEAELIGHATAAALQFHDKALAGTNLAFLRARPTIRLAAIYDPSGGVFATYARDGGASAAELPSLPPVPGSRIADERIDVSHRIVVDGEVLGTVYLGADLPMYRRALSYASILLATSLAALGVSVAFSQWLQRAITRPLVQIAGVAREVVQRRDYSVRAQRTTEDEIGTLAEAFNNMLSEIEQRTKALQASADENARLNADLERRVAERTAQLEESNRLLESASRAKDQFLAGMSHELRTPLNAVIGFTGTLLMKLPGPLNQEQEKQLRTVQGSARHLLALINDLLDVARIEAGKVELVPEVCVCQEIVEDVLASLRPQAESRGLELVASLPAEEIPVRTDRRALRQIVLNLAGNAIKFTDKGYVHVRLGRRDAGDRRLVEISFEDTGVGIRPEDHDKLFAAFSQVDASSRRRSWR
jgi:signal transduction histidine kinase